MTRAVLMICFCCLLIPAGGAVASDRRFTYEDDFISLHLTPRTPEQIAAFYEARGFPVKAREHLTASCLMTVGIHNHSNTIVWLELDNWRFYSRNGEVRRLNRAYWNNLWEKLSVPPANRATFGWTQLPERRDLRPDEPVGGNVAVQPPAGPFALEARFRTGRAGEGKEIRVTLSGIVCPRPDGGND